MVVPSCALINLYGAAVDPGSDTLRASFNLWCCSTAMEALTFPSPLHMEKIDFRKFNGINDNDFIKRGGF